MPKLYITDEPNSFAVDGKNGETRKIFISLNDLKRGNSSALLYAHENAHLILTDKGEEIAKYAETKIGENKNKFTESEKEEYISKLKETVKIDKTLEEQFEIARSIPETDRENYEAITIPIDVVGNIGGIKGEFGLIYNNDNGKEEFGLIYGGQILYGINTLTGVDFSVNLFSKENASIKDFEGFYGGVKASAGYLAKYNFSIDIMDNKGEINQGLSLGSPNIGAFGGLGYRKVYQLNSLSDYEKEKFKSLLRKKEKIKDTTEIMNFLREVNEIHKMNSVGDKNAKSKN